MATDRYTIELTIEGNDRSSTQLNRVNRELDDLDKNSRNAKNNMDGLGVALQAAAAGFVVDNFARAVGELNALGTEANKAETVFTKLSGGTDAAATALDNLRSRTGGVVDDLTLMQGANSLLLTNLASTTDEAAQLTEVAVQLGAAMGQDAAASIENFNAALLNNSFQRLDTLGISAAAVRERVAELKEEGLDMSEAFAQATLEQGRQALERLGDAADVSQSAMARLGTSIQNRIIDLGQLVAGAGEAAAQLAILADIAAGGDGFGTIDRDFQDRTQSRIDAQSPVSAFGVDGVTVTQLFNNNRDLFEAVSGGAFSNFASGQTFAGAGAFGSGVSTARLDEAASALGVQNFSGLSGDRQIAAARELDTALRAVRDTYLELNPIVAQSSDTLNENADALGGGAVAADDEAEAIRRFYQSFADNQANAFGDVERIFDRNTLGFGGGTFFDPSALADLRTEVAEIEAEAENIKFLAEQSEFVTDDDVQAAQDLAERAREYADEAERGAEAFQNANLGQLFGQTSGGSLGQLSDRVLAGIDNQTLRQNAEREFGLATGQETNLSLVFEEQLIPLLTRITEEEGIAAGSEATQRAQEALVSGRAAGLSEEQIVASVREAVGFELQQSFNPFTREVDSTLVSTQEEGGGTFSTESADNSDRIVANAERLAEIPLDDNLNGFNDDLDSAVAAADTLIGNLSSISGLKLQAEVPLRIVVDNQTGFELQPLIREQINLVLSDGLTGEVVENP